MRLRSFRLTAAFALLAAAGLAHSQAYPSRPVTMIVPYAPGGSVDAVARFVVPKLTERLGQQVVVDNAVGAGGVILKSVIFTAAVPLNDARDASTRRLSVTGKASSFVTPATVRLPFASRFTCAPFASFSVNSTSLKAMRGFSFSFIVSCITASIALPLLHLSEQIGRAHV